MNDDCRANGCDIPGHKSTPPTTAERALEPRVPGKNPKDLVGAKKAPLGLVPQALVIGAAEAMAVGEGRYGPFNWRDYPVQMMSYLEAMQRHIAALIDGEDCASDTGVHHLKHVVAGGGILLDSLGLGIVIDNRPKPGPAAKLLAEQDKSKAVPMFCACGEVPAHVPGGKT